MTKLISNSLLACGFALAITSLAAHAAPVAASKTVKAVKSAKPPAAKARVKPAIIKTALQKPQVEEEQGPAPVVPEAEPDITGSAITQYSCELGNTVTIYTNEVDTANIALRWKKRLHRLSRVGTTTGANRFENKNFGLTWIGIPSKGLLLDSRLNRQLANECKSPEQENPAVVVAPVAAVPPTIVSRPDPAAPPAVLMPEAALPATLPASAGSAPVMLAVPAGTQSVVVPIPPGTTAVVVPVPAGASSVVVPVPVGTAKVPPATTLPASGAPPVTK